MVKSREDSRSDSALSALSEIQRALTAQQDALAMMISRGRVVVRATFALLATSLVLGAIIATGIWGARIDLSDILGLAGTALALIAGALAIAAWLSGELGPRLLAFLGALFLAGLALTASWSFSLFDKLGIDLTIGESPLADCGDCGRSTPLGELRFGAADGLDLECGGAEPRSVGLFQDREPPPRSGQAASPLEGGHEAAEINEVLESLRHVQRGDPQRSLAGIILIGSADERPIGSPFVGKPHPDNAKLALARARWVGDKLKERLLPFEPSIMIVNSDQEGARADIPLARLVLGGRKHFQGVEQLTSREVLVCGLWRLARLGS